MVLDETSTEKIKSSLDNSTKTNVAHRLKKSKPHHKAAQRKGSMVFEETSTEKIKSSLDKGFGLLSPWNKNTGDVFTSCLGQQGGQPQQQGLLNQPINPMMHINGWPINPRGANFKSLGQTIDGNLQEEEEDLREVMSQITGRKAGFRSHRFGGGGWRPLKPINYPMHRIGMGGRGMLGNINANDGYRRGNTMHVHAKKKNDIFKNLHGLILKKMYEKRLAKLRTRRLQLLKLQARRARLLKIIRNAEQADKMKLINC